MSVNAWLEQIDFEEKELKKILKDVSKEAREYDIYPPKHLVFKALELCPPDNTKVVILGQDPYPREGHATGLAFGVPNDVLPKPPTLLNIFKELEIENVYRSNLEGWAKQGVLLLNTFLTIRAGVPLSHRTMWEEFTDSIILSLNKRFERVVFLLWGLHARKKKELITNPLHIVIETVHPSPLSADKGFFGSKCFEKANRHLKQPIDWKQTT